MDFYSIYQKVTFLVPEPPLPKESFAIITAHNPRGTILNTEDNFLLNQKLLEQLQDYKYTLITGCSLDLKHQEASFAVICNKEQAIELARQFEQNAIYWVEKEELWLLPVLLNWPDKSLGNFSSYIKNNL